MTNEGNKTETDKIEEFVCVWFEGAQKWVVVFPDGKVIDDGFGSVGYAVNAALNFLDRWEAEFDCTADSGDFYSYQKCDDFWRVRSSS